MNTHSTIETVSPAICEFSWKSSDAESLLIKSYQSKSLSNLNTSNPKREQVEDKLTWRDFCTPRECCFLSFSRRCLQEGKRKTEDCVSEGRRRKDGEKVWRKFNLSYVYVNAIIRAFVLSVWKLRAELGTTTNGDAKVWIIYYCCVTLGWAVCAETNGGE